MELWNKIEEIGSLYKEIDLVIGTEPVLFVCKKYRTKERYLVMAYNSYERIYIIAPINNKVLLNMLSNQITMEQAFRKCDTILTTQKGSKSLIIEKHDSSSFQGNMLPKVDEYYELDYEYIRRYRDKLESELGYHYVTIRKCITQDGYSPYKHSAFNRHITSGMKDYEGRRPSTKENIAMVVDSFKHTTHITVRISLKQVQKRYMKYYNGEFNHAA